MEASVKIYKAMCTHPMCPGREGYAHCKPHPYDEEACKSVCCGMLEEPSFCNMVATRDGEIIGLSNK